MHSSTPSVGTDSRSGMALIMVMIFIAGLATLGTALLNYTGTHARLARERVDREAAFYIAEAALERAVSHVANGGSVPAAFSGEFGDGEYRVSISYSGGAEGDVSTATTVHGDILINPNNSPHSSFQMTMADGTVVTRDDLANASYAGCQGIAALIVLKPHGNGNQNGLSVGGEPYLLENTHTYRIASDAMDILLYNDKQNGSGKAIGAWHVQIVAPAAVVEVIK